MKSERIDRAERTVAASADKLYRAFLEPELLEEWLPPEGMAGKVHEINAFEGGGYVMSLYYGEALPDVVGKTTEREDRFRVIFDELKPGMRVVQRVVFDASDPSFTGAMKQTWTLSTSGSSTRVSVACENVPPGVRPEDHAVGLRSSLEKLALVFEFVK